MLNFKTYGQGKYFLFVKLVPQMQYLLGYQYYKHSPLQKLKIFPTKLTLLHCPHVYPSLDHESNSSHVHLLHPPIQNLEQIKTFPETYLIELQGVDNEELSQKEFQQV